MAKLLSPVEHRRWSPAWEKLYPRGGSFFRLRTVPTTRCRLSWTVGIERSNVNPKHDAPRSCGVRSWGRVTSTRGYTPAANTPGGRDGSTWQSENPRAEMADWENRRTHTWRVKSNFSNYYVIALVQKFRAKADLQNIFWSIWKTEKAIL